MRSGLYREVLSHWLWTKSHGGLITTRTSSLHMYKQPGTHVPTWNPFTNMHAHIHAPHTWKWKNNIYQWQHQKPHFLSFPPLTGPTGPTQVLFLTSTPHLHSVSIVERSPHCSLAKGNLFLASFPSAQLSQAQLKFPLRQVSLTHQLHSTSVVCFLMSWDRSKISSLLLLIIVTLSSGWLQPPKSSTTIPSWHIVCT